MQEHHLQVQRTARYHTAGNLDANTTEVWIVIHGFAQLASSFLQSFEALQNDNRFFIAPEGLNRFYLRGGYNEVGATWMTKEDRQHEIEDYVFYLDKLYDTVLSNISPTVKIKALGFSQGVATISRWAYHTTKCIDDLILYAGEIPAEFHSAEGIKQLCKGKNYFIYGTKDKIVPADKVEPFKQLLSGFDMRTFEGGHEINTEVLKNL